MQQKRARTIDPGTAAAGEAEVLQVFVLDMEERSDAASIVLYGCTRDRRSVMLTVEGFRFYFLVGAAESGVIGSSGLRSDVSVNYNVDHMNTNLCTT